MKHDASANDVGHPSAQAIVHSHFDVQTEKPQRQLLAWRERVGHVIDVLPSRSDLERPFRASIDHYSVGDLAFTDCRSDAMLLDRSLTRISRDRMRNYGFQVFLDGDAENVAVRSRQRKDAAPLASILAVDLGQPFTMRRNACRVLSFFVPGELVQETFPDPEALHGRTLQNSTPLTRLVFQHVSALARDIASMEAGAAQVAIRAGTQLLVAAFSKQAGLSGNARAAARVAMFAQVRRYIQANLGQEGLSPETVLEALQLPRRTLYRLFEHEGGLAAYIRHLRLRDAADQLVRYPNLPVMEIAFGLAFKSASDFTRAFRRAYDMAPLDFRLASLTAAMPSEDFRHEGQAGIGASACEARMPLFKLACSASARQAPLLEQD